MTAPSSWLSQSWHVGAKDSAFPQRVRITFDGHIGWEPNTIWKQDRGTSEQFATICLHIWMSSRIRSRNTLAIYARVCVCACASVCACMLFGKLGSLGYGLQCMLHAACLSVCLSVCLSKLVAQIDPSSIRRRIVFLCFNSNIVDLSIRIIHPSMHADDSGHSVGAAVIR